MADYVPRPIATTAVTLEPALAALVERLAENVHDTWAKKRLEDGWTHGPERNDAKRQHPCLVSYSELPESEKDYDRAVVSETIKAAIALGYSISKI